MGANNKNNKGNCFYMITEEQLKQMITNAILEAKEQVEEERKNAEEVAAMSRNEAAARLRVSVHTLWRWARDGYLVPKRVGRRVLYLKSDVDKIIQKGVEIESK